MAPELMKAMRAVKAKEGIPVAVQIDFAVRAWLKAKGITIEPLKLKVVVQFSRNLMTFSIPPL